MTNYLSYNLVGGDYLFVEGEMHLSSEIHSYLSIPFLRTLHMVNGVNYWKGMLCLAVTYWIFVLPQFFHTWG